MTDRKITIQEEAPGTAKVKPIRQDSRVDLQDVFLVLGFSALVGGTVAVNWKAGLMLAGILFLVAAYLIERQKRTASPKK